MIRRPSPVTLSLPLLILLAIAGCSPPDQRDQRLAEMAQDATERQAQQNEEMSRLNREVAENNRQLLEADADSRREVLELQHELVQRDEQCRQELTALHREVQANIGQERASLDRQHEELEDERSEIAKQTQRAPVIAEAIKGAVLLLACLCPLALTAYLIHALNGNTDDETAINELLVSEIMSDQPRLLPSPQLATQRLAHETSAQRQPGTNAPEDATEQ